MSAKKAFSPRNGSLTKCHAPWLRFRAEHPDLSDDDAKIQYEQWLNSIGLLNVTPYTDMVGWICNRMVGHTTQDCIIVVYGRRGSGKSFLCGYLGERIDKRLSFMLKTKPGTHFSIDNVRSVDKSGTLEMMDTKTLREREQRVFVLDDASITVNARNFQSPENKYINDILTTARIYRHCMIINTISSNQIDSVARSFADIGILTKGVIRGTNINRCYLYHMDRSNPLGLGRKPGENIGKHHQITIDNEQFRIIPWYAYKPSDAFIEAYNIIRKENTDKLGQETDSWVAKVGGNRVDSRHVHIMEKYNDVVALAKKKNDKGKGMSIRAMARETGLSSSGVDYIIGKAKQAGDL